MKNPYKKGKVHPTPPLLGDLSFLPLAILALTAALTAEDREVLAYLLSCSAPSAATTKKNTHNPEHPPMFNCNCFGCYTSYWSRWGVSSKRELIHDILDAYEEELTQRKNKKERKKRNKKKLQQADAAGSAGSGSGCAKRGAEVEKEEAAVVTAAGAEESEKGAVRKIASLIGGLLWAAWN